MTKAQAFTISIVFSFVVLGLFFVAFLLFFPYDQVFAPTPTITSTHTATPTASRTVVPLPTAKPDTATPGPPTPVNTLVPTTTPLPSKTPTPPVDFSFPTPIIKPTDTPVPPIPGPEVTASPTVTNEPIRQYSIVFEATKYTITNKECTELSWQVSGQVAVWLDGKAVDAAGRQEVCPNRTTTYTLATQLIGSAEITKSFVEIKVK